MKRLQKKCIIASAGFHLFLVLILVIGPGFISSKSTPAPDMPILTFVPVKTTDDQVSGGGERDAKPPPAVETPKPPVELEKPAAPPPDPTPDPEPPKTAAKDPTPVKPDRDDSLTPAEKPTRRKPDVSTTLVTRTTDPNAESKAREAAAAKAAAERRRLAKLIEGGADAIGNGVSDGVSFKLVGPGGGGVPYANFLQAVKSAYLRALVTPDNLQDESATTVASVTIARDGSVVSAHIIRRSGDDQLDRAVQRTLDRVKYAAPLPDNATEDERTVEIIFNARSKRGFG